MRRKTKIISLVVVLTLLVCCLPLISLVADAAAATKASFNNYFADGMYLRANYVRGSYSNTCCNHPPK